MTRTAVAFLLLAFVLTGCSGSTGDSPQAQPGEPPASLSPASSAPSTTAPPAPPLTTGPPAAADGSDVGACFDGECEIAVSAPVEFPVDPQLGIDTLSVTEIGPDSVAVAASGPGMSLQVGLSPGGTGTLNNLTVRVEEITGGTAILVFSSAR